MTKNGIIAKFDRRIFNFISSPKFKLKEYGGYMDFNKGKLERFRVNIGHLNYVDIDSDYEVIYHTHPGDIGHISPPTPDDVMFIVSSPKQQAHLVFLNNLVYILIPTQKMRSLYSRVGDAELENLLNNKWQSLFNKLRINKINKKFEQQWIAYLKNIGMKIIKKTNMNNDLHIPIKSIEPNVFPKMSTWQFGKKKKRK